MVYDIENIFVCLAAPLTLMFLLLSGEARRLNLFLIVGMAVCLLSGSLNLVLADWLNYSIKEASVLLAPICEELLKLLPLLFYAYLFRLSPNQIFAAAVATGIGFATLENCCYIAKYGSQDLWFVVIRGFSTGFMHGLCTALVGFGLNEVRTQKKLAYTGTFALLCLAATYHASYNLLVQSADYKQYLGICLPMLTALVWILLRKKNKSWKEFFQLFNKQSSKNV